MVNLDTHELAWAAGFFDGEGCTSGGRKLGGRKGYVRPYPFVVLQITQTNLDLLERFRAAVASIGNINGPYDSKSPKRGINPRPQYQWFAGNWAKSQAVLALLWTYLSEEKRTQAHHWFSNFHTAWREESKAPRISLAEAEDMRRVYAEGNITVSDLATRYGISKSYAWDIARNRNRRGRAKELPRNIPT